MLRRETAATEIRGTKGPARTVFDLQSDLNGTAYMGKDLFLSVLSASTTKRDVKSYISRFQASPDHKIAGDQGTQYLFPGYRLCIPDITTHQINSMMPRSTPSRRRSCTSPLSSSERQKLSTTRRWVVSSKHSRSWLGWACIMLS